MIRSILISSFFALLFYPSFSVTLWASTPWTVDGSRFLETPFDSSSEEDRALEEKWLRPPEKPFPFAKGELKSINGIRTIVIDDEPMPSWSRSTFVPIPGAPTERLLREQGVKLFFVQVNLTSEGDREGDRSLAQAPEPAFAQFKTRVDRILASVPDARIIVHAWMMNVAQDYLQLYPDAVLEGEDGETDWGWGYYYGYHNKRSNMLSEWRRYCGEHLYHFLHRVGNSEYAPHVAGVYVGAMSTGEWAYFKGKGDPGWDYSPGRKKIFREYALAKYGSAEMASKAWGVKNDEHLFDLPSLQERNHWPLQPESKSADYLEILNLPVTQAADYFGQIIKNTSNGNLLSGMEIHAAFFTSPTNGTVFLQHLLESPHIDLFGGPSAYENRGVGKSPFYRVAAATLDAHDKLWLNEGDYRTHFSYGTPNGAVGEPPLSADETRQLLYREFARGVAFNYVTYLMDAGWNWFVGSRTIQTIHEIIQADRLVKQLGVERKNEVAIITDQESQIYSNYYSNPIAMMLDNTLDRLGTGWDFYGMKDFFASSDQERYKLIVFLNIRALNQGERDQINALKTNNRTLVWLHDSGIVDLTHQDSDPAELISTLTGITMKAGLLPKKIHANPDAFQKAGFMIPAEDISMSGGTTTLFREVSPGDAATNRPFGNRPTIFHSIDTEAVSLGEDAEGRAFIVMKEFENWTSFYSTLPKVEPELLRQLAKKAGCHLYLETNDVFFSAGNWIAVHAGEAGEKHLSFPEPTGVYDVFHDKIVSSDPVKSIKLHLKKHETRLLYLGDPSQAATTAATIRSDMEKEKAAFIHAAPAPDITAGYKTYFPKSPEKGGAFKIETDTLPALLTTGPFSSKETETLDEVLASLHTLPAWETLDKLNFSLKADSFLQVVPPQSFIHTKEAKTHWYGVDLKHAPGDPRTPEIWIPDYRMGMATGQSYAVAFYLEADNPTPMSMYVAVEGESRLWIDGKEIQPEENGYYEPVLTATSQAKLIVLRIKGEKIGTGFTIKLAGPERGIKGYSQERPGNIAMPIPTDPDKLSPPPSGLRIRLPEKKPLNQEK